MKKYAIFLSLILIIGFLIWTIYIPKEPSSSRTVVFSVKPGEGSRDISINLQKEGLIRWGIPFRIYVLTVGIAGRLQAGSYSFSPAMNVPQIAEKMAKGETIKNQLTVVEGWTIKDIDLYFKDNQLFQKEDFLAATKQDFSNEYDFLKEKPKNVSLEGFLFPDTYEINGKASAQDVVRLMLANFDKKMTPDLRLNIKQQNKTVFETVIMASLIEKEVKTKDDKKIVSGILWKRLKIGMPLQVDSTISYITGKQTAQISTADLKISSQFNTYKYKGLPPGPISNPGLESIEAAVHPEDSPYLYYLSAPDGRTIFSKTLEEHNAAKTKYLKS